MMKNFSVINFPQLYIFIYIKCPLLLYFCTATKCCAIFFSHIYIFCICCCFANYLYECMMLEAVQCPHNSYQVTWEYKTTKKQQQEQQIKTLRPSLSPSLREILLFFHIYILLFCSMNIIVVYINIKYPQRLIYIEKNST